MKPLERKDGTPTAYGFRCGYGMVAFGLGRSVSLYFVNQAYEVKAVDDSKRSEGLAWAEQHGWNDPAMFRVWVDTASLDLARRAFAQQCKRLKLNPKGLV